MCMIAGEISKLQKHTIYFYWMDFDVQTGGTNLLLEYFEYPMKNDKFFTSSKNVRIIRRICDFCSLTPIVA